MSWPSTTSPPRPAAGYGGIKLPGHKAAYTLEQLLEIQSKSATHSLALGMLLDRLLTGLRQLFNRPLRWNAITLSINFGEQAHDVEDGHRYSIKMTRPRTKKLELIHQISQQSPSGVWLLRDGEDRYTIGDRADDYIVTRMDPDERTRVIDFV